MLNKVNRFRENAEILTSQEGGGTDLQKRLASWGGLCNNLQHCIHKSTHVNACA